MKTNKELYFQVNENSFEKLEMKRFESEYGFKGIGIWLKLNAMLIINYGFLPIDYKIISTKRSEQKFIENVIRESGMFIVDGDLFYSEDINNQLKERGKYSDLQRQKVLKMWNKKKGITNNSDLKEVNYSNDFDSSNLQPENKYNFTESNKSKEIDEIFEKFDKLESNPEMDELLLSKSGKQLLEEEIL
jgi:hypothetical protein